MSRKPKLYDKPWERTIDKTKAERDLGYGRLKDFCHNKSVQIFWNLSPEATADGIFMLRIGKEEIFLDKEEFQKFLRWC